MSFLIIILFLMMPLSVSAAAKDALTLCLQSVIPSLFPFMAAAKCAVITRDIKEDNVFFKGIARLFNIPLSGVISFIFGLLCGYPIGAKTAFDLLREGRIEKREAIRLACFANNAGPAFVISVVGAEFLNSAFLGVIIYISHIAASVITGIIIRGQKREYIYSRDVSGRIPLTEAIPSAIYDSGLSVINVTAVIMFFSAVSSLFFKIIPQTLSSNPLYMGLISGFFEITSGIKLVSSSSASLPLRLSVITMLTSFSGISIIFQTKAFAKGLNIKTTPCILCKVLSAFISFFICYFLTIAILFFARES